jgi:hypothetical protein
LIEAKPLPAKFWLVRNLFIKCKHILVNIKKPLPLNMLGLISTYAHHLEEKDEGPQLTPRQYR